MPDMEDAEIPFCEQEPFSIGRDAGKGGTLSFCRSVVDQFTLTHALVRQMEGAAIAQVCCLNGTPFVIIRAISDKADDSEEVSYVEFERAAAERCAAVTRYMVTH